MKLTVLLIVFSVFGANAIGIAQGITLSGKDLTLRQVFKAIEQQTGYVVFGKKELLSKASPVTIAIKNGSIKEVLETTLHHQSIQYRINDATKTIVLSYKPVASEQAPPLRIRVTDSLGNPLTGASIFNKTTGKSGTADVDGQLSLHVSAGDVIVVTYIGYTPQTITVKEAGTPIMIVLKQAASKLDEIVFKGYYSTSQRLNTGSVAKVSSAVIEKQPVHNPLGALQGRVPGLFLTQTNGLPGSNFTVQIRGVNSLTQGKEPLYIVDGVPFPTDNLAQRAHLNVSHPLNTINNADIESIEILKDADATAIYGSRGANGVVLITTKRSKMSEGTRLDVNLSHGVSFLGHTMDFMNTEQYLEMRKEAFANDGITPNNSNAYDLLLWPQDRYENWKDVFLKKAAGTSDAQVRLYGGGSATKFTLGLGYRKEGTISPGDQNVQRGSGDLNIIHTSPSNKFMATISARYSSNVTNLANQDFFESIALPPNAPPVFNEEGKLNWPASSQLSSVSKYAAIYREFKGVTDNASFNTVLKYTIAKGLDIKTSIGYNSVLFDEENITPIISQAPYLNPLGSRNKGMYKTNSWIGEPQIIYNRALWKGTLETLFGASWQQNTTVSNMLTISGIKDDALIYSNAAGTQLSSGNTFNEYRYQAFFGRINYNLSDKYIINLSGRRDGSSRFGPGRRYSNFGAVGAAWIFSKERFAENNLRFLNFGKLRASYGITGNDQIINYQFLNTWSGTTKPYNGTNGLLPARLFNPDYRWELNKKFETAIELGLLDNRLFFNAAYFHNRSSNQLINFNLPSQTGFKTVLRNFPAVIQNAGLEMELRTTNVAKKNFSWTTGVNITFYRNKLVEFPGLENTSYATRYIIGQPLSVEQGYRFLGVNPQTGVYEFEDLNHDGKYNSLDYIVLGSADPKYYGGVNNTITFKGFQLDFLFQFVKQLGSHPIYSRSSNNGAIGNLPVMTLDRWQQPGDVAPYQMFSTTSGTPAYNATNLIYNSTAKLTDASYVRLKNISLYYSIPERWGRVLKMKKCNIYVQAQNLLTITNYIGNDPEVASYLRTPPLKVITTGFQLSL
ncbi:SusC/RagA family TonB-linked outer membrane protein [Chitinophaga defluvii]|uniref:SusC/RagA family TonB-linked outer membrane protein n=1 Tax=Chitinophaga defluvii TaxID=3163343 RepID=A0ABV2TBF2_9BACT